MSVLGSSWIQKAVPAIWWALLVWIVLGPSAHLGWMVGALTVSWSLHAGFALLPYLASDLRRRSWPRVGAGLVALGLAWWPWTGPLQDARAPNPSSDEPRLRMMVANTFYSPARHDVLTADIEASGAGLVALLEPPASLPNYMATTGRWTVLAQHAEGPTKWNIALMARTDLLGRSGGLKVHTATVVRRSFTEAVAIEARIQWMQRDLHVIAAHAPAPTDPGQQAQRVLFIPDLGRSLDAPGVLLADLNTTMVSPLWGTLMQQGLRRTEGPTPATWPSWFGPLGVAIDHALLKGDLSGTATRAVWLSGSDHRGLIVDIGP